MLVPATRRRLRRPAESPARSFTTGGRLAPEALP